MDCFYFIIVTVTTLGYGDILPVTYVSRVIVLVIIMAGFCIIPTQVALLAQTIYSKPKYLGLFSSKTYLNHIVICGMVDDEFLDRFVSELQGKHRGTREMSNTIVVILSPVVPTNKVHLSSIYLLLTNL
jgi:hypothetical protein